MFTKYKFRPLTRANTCFIYKTIITINACFMDLSKKSIRGLLLLGNNILLHQSKCISDFLSKAGQTQ